MAAVVVRITEVVVPIVDHTEAAAQAAEALMAEVARVEEELLLNFDLKKHA